MRKPNIPLLLAGLLVALPSAAQSNGGGEAGATEAAQAADQLAPLSQRGPAPSGKPAPGDEFHFDYHGFIRAPLRVGKGKRTAPLPGQSSSTFHEPLLVDDQYLNWNYTRSQEKAWAEMFFSYGNSHVTGTVAITGYNFDDWEHYPDAQWGISQGWVTLRPDLGLDNTRVEWKVGSFWEKFGQAGKYDAGPYDTYLFGRTHQMGESLSGEVDLDDGDLTLNAEHGFGAHGEGVQYQFTAFSFINHAHVGLTYLKKLKFNLHWLNAFEQDGNPANPDGTMTVFGPELRYEGGILGDLYLGYSYIRARHATEIGPVIEVVHSQGGGGGFGIDLTSNFFNPIPSMTATPTAAESNGTGNIGTLEFNYEYSFGLLWRELAHPGVGFWGEGTDVKLALFGMYTKVTDVTAVDGSTLPTSGIGKLKFGGDLTLSLLPWFALGTRFDRVEPNMKDSLTYFSVISPRMVFRTSWNSHEAISLVWSHYTYGAAIDHGPPNWPEVGFNGPRASYGGGGGQAPYWTTNGPASISRPDHDAFTIKATMWW